MLRTWPLSYWVCHCFNKMPTISPCGKGVYISLLFSSLFFLLTFMTFIPNVNNLNCVAITARTKKGIDMLHVANEYCQAVHRLIEILHMAGWAGRANWGAKLNLQPNSDSLFIFLFSAKSKKTTVFCLLAHNYFFIRHPFNRCYNCLDQNTELHAGTYHVAQQTSAVLSIILESPCHFGAE